MPRGVRKVAPIKTVTVAIGGVSIDVTPDLRDTINQLRPKLMGFSDEFHAITIKKGELAAPFMDGFALWAHVTGRSFVDYVRAIDPTIPGDREGYKSHKTYMAAEYLKRSITSGAGRNQGGDGQTQRERSQPTRTNAVGRMARLLSTILQIVKPEDHATLWQALADELALTPRQVSNLKAGVDATQPLFTLPLKRKVSAEVVHIGEHAAAKAA